jgi:hypothetical protein
MSAQAEFDMVYEALREIMIPYANDLDLKNDSAGSLYIDTNHIMKNGKPLFFGAVQIKKRYVSFHLMPVYVNSGLIDLASAALQKRMHGKSCFNFTAADDALFAELRDLTRSGFEDFRKQGFV